MFYTVSDFFVWLLFFTNVIKFSPFVFALRRSRSSRPSLFAARQWSRVTLATVNETCLINVFAPRRSRSSRPSLFAERQFSVFGTLVLSFHGNPLSFNLCLLFLLNLMKLILTIHTILFKDKRYYKHYKQKISKTSAAPGKVFNFLY